MRQINLGLPQDLYDQINTLATERYEGNVTMAVRYLLRSALKPERIYEDLVPHINRAFIDAEATALATALRP